MTGREGAREPEDPARLFAQRALGRDAAGLAELYEPDAVLAYPPGQQTVGRDAIRRVMAQMLAAAPEFKPEQPLPTVRFGDLALTSTRRPTIPAGGSRSPGAGRTGRGCGSWTGPRTSYFDLKK
jgi:uncharacterized protein (TIGR02246 family)